VTAPTSDRNRRAMIIGAVGLVAVILILVIPRLGGGGSPSSSPPTTAPGTVLPGLPGAPSTTTTEVAPGFEAFMTKDPFTPLASPVGAPGGSAGGGAGSSTSTTAASSAPGGSGAGASAAGASGGGSTAPSQGQTVALLDVYASNGSTVASIRVNDSVYRASPGQTFDTNYKVVSLDLSTGCGQFLFGDSEFKLCKGQQVLK